MGKKQTIVYTIEREFLCKYSVEDLIKQIIQNHNNCKAEKLEDKR